MFLDILSNTVSDFFVACVISCFFWVLKKTGMIIPARGLQLNNLIFSRAKYSLWMSDRHTQLSHPTGTIGTKQLLHLGYLYFNVFVFLHSVSGLSYFSSMTHS